MIGAGTFINPLIKVVATVAILAAAYFFIVKPVLNTTENVSNSVGGAFQGLDDVGPNVRESVREAQKIADQQQADSQAQIDEANKLLECIGDAEGDVNQIQRCNQKFDPSNP